MAYKKDKEKNIENVIDFNDEKINVIIMGISGSGKSTLINAIMEDDVATVGVGDAVTDGISVYEKDNIPFRMIDTVGYEFGIFRQMKIKNELKRFSKEGVKNTEINKLIHAIWFCIDGTSKRVDQNTLDYIRSVSNDWAGVPIIIVFTKSYSEVDIEENVNMAKAAVDKYNSTHKKKTMNVIDYIPVVALEYQINETVTVPQKGLDQLIEKTVEIAPQAKNIARDNVFSIDLKLKQKMAQSVVLGTTVGAAGVGAVNIAIPDATVLMPMQSAMLSRIAKTYHISDDAEKKEIIDRLLKAGLAALVGKTLVEQIKKIPGLNIAGAVINGFVAGSVTLALGEISINLFERIYKGEDLSGTNWDEEIKKQFDQYMPKVIEIVANFAKNNDKVSISSLKDIAKSFFKSDKDETKADKKK